MDPSGISGWWQPRQLAHPMVLECRFEKQIGSGAIIIDSSKEAVVVVYFYGYDA